MQLTFSGDVSSKFGHGNAKFKLLFISLKIDCFYGLWTIEEILAEHNHIIGLASP